MSDFTLEELTLLRTGIEELHRAAQDEYRKIPGDTSRYLKRAASDLYEADAATFQALWHKLTELHQTTIQPPVPTAARATDAAGHPVTYDPAVDTTP